MYQELAQKNNQLAQNNLNLLAMNNLLTELANLNKKLTDRRVEEKIREHIKVNLYEISKLDKNHPNYLSKLENYLDDTKDFLEEAKESMEDYIDLLKRRSEKIEKIKNYKEQETLNVFDLANRYLKGEVLAYTPEIAEKDKKAATKEAKQKLTTTRYEERLKECQKELDTYTREVTKLEKELAKKMESSN